MTARVVVVGAAGFIGSAIVRALAGSGRATVTAAVRRPNARLSAMGAEVRICDATAAVSVEAAMNGATHVVNCVMAGPAAMQQATRNIAEAARAAGCARLVHLSSIAVYGDKTGLLTEDVPLGHGVNAYGQGKLACEEIVRQAAGPGLPSIILRPSCVYGPGSELWTGRIGRMLRAHRLGDLGAAGDGWCNLVHVDDVARAVLAGLDTQIGTVEVCNLSDPEPPTWNQYLMRFARLIGAVPVARIPPWQFTLETKFAAIPLKVAQMAGAKAGIPVKWLPDPVTPSLKTLFSQDVRFEYRHADRVLRFGRTPPDRGLADAATWFNARSSVAKPDASTNEPKF